ncbi:NAD(P)-dependent oxidoreductase [Mycolicibacterium sp. XJ1819]
MRVGFIGLGDQGGPMARRVIDAGHPVTLWARRAESLAPYTDTSAETAASPRELGKVSDVVCICVVDEAGVRQVLLGDDGVLAGLSAGGMVAVHSTISPGACGELAETAREVGVDFIDAPVSGGGQAAAAGRLLVMVGAGARVFEKCRPVFESYGDPVLHVGDVGTAQRVKLINNAMMAANTAVALHALELADALGVDRSAAATAIRHGSGHSRALDLLGQFELRREAFPDHAVALLRKDVQLMLALDRAVGDGAGEALADVAQSLLGENNPSQLSAR